MKTMARLAASALPVCTLFLAGCSVLAPQPDTSHFFVLAPLQMGDAQQNGSESVVHPNMMLGLGPIKLPPYLDRNEIALRLSPTQVTYSAVDRWAEPLNVNVSRVLLQNLSELLGTDRIVMYPWSNAMEVEYQIRVELLSFEATKSGDAQLTARYGILPGGGRQAVAAREANFSRPAGTDTATAVAALSATLGDLSHDIAATLRQLPKPQATPAARHGKS
ncbi:MAG TPA: PqiC family protein [Candidatus Margulisiibacteriota bacterium]|nr:PqiC family protein [Candidatus Margulisiibacteriota bacterium]